jgi:NodT family efflux transporter outer membrane factor (OMF) lipoprotein
MRDAVISVVLTACCCLAAAPALPQERDASVAASSTTATAPAEAPGVESILSFWRELHDATLDRLMDEVLRANLDVRSAEARLAGARSARHAAELELLPTGSVDGDYTRQRLSPASFPGATGVFPDQSIWDIGFGVSWELDATGRLRRSLDAQRALEAATDAGLNDVRVSLAAELATTYFELLGAADQLQVAERNTENQRRTLDLTQQRLDAGRGTAFDTERAHAQLSFTSASMPALEAAVDAARYRIGVLVGRAPEAVAGELKTLGDLPTPPPAAAIGDPEMLLRQRPDVAAAEHQLLAETALLGAAKAERRPRLTLGASAGYSAVSLDAIGERGTFRYVLQSAISWPAFGLSRLNAGVAVARAQEAQARSAYDQAMLRAREEVDTALSRYRAARVRVERIQEAASSSTRAAELARLRFSDGLGDLLDVLDAERTQLEAESQLVQARTAAATSYAALFRALGGALPETGGAAGR